MITTRNRHEYLENCVRSLLSQADTILVIDNKSEPSIRHLPIAATIIDYHVFPPNISQMWNIGIKWTQLCAQIRRIEHWDVAIFNDDTEVPPGWMVVLSDTMRRMGAAAACSGSAGPDPVLYGPDLTPGVWNRLTGWAFMIRGESGLELDEDFAWWCGDDDLSMRARQQGGIVRVPGLHVPNFLADSTTNGMLAEQAAKDMAHFVKKWGVRPW